MLFIFNLIAFCTTVFFVTLFMQTFISVLLTAFQPSLLMGFTFSVMEKKSKDQGLIKKL